jgi:hypothetical protein
MSSFIFAALASIASRSFLPLSKYEKNDMNDIEEELNFDRCPFREWVRGVRHSYIHSLVNLFMIHSKFQSLWELPANDYPVSHCGHWRSPMKLMAFSSVNTAKM